MSTIGKRIKDRRTELGMSADELADKLKKNRATIYRYESDEIENFPIQIIGPLADALQVTPAYLMGWEPKNERPPAKSDEGPLNAELISRLSRLTAEELEKVDAFVQGLLASH